MELIGLLIPLLNNICGKAGAKVRISGICCRTIMLRMRKLIRIRPGFRSGSLTLRRKEQQR